MEGWAGWLLIEFIISLIDPCQHIIYPPPKLVKRFSWLSYASQVGKWLGMYKWGGLQPCEQNINRTMSSNKTPEEQEFEARLAKAFYKTTAQNIGQTETKLPAERENGINGKFTDHLIYSGMYRNASLNTTADKDRWLNGSKDWMEHLG